jgi:hypothetical protein
METRSIKAPSPRAAHRSPPSQSEAPGRTPASEVDPFSIEFFEDPFPVTLLQRSAAELSQSPARTVHVRRTYSGRPSSSMRLSEATAIATSVLCRRSVRERSASPITRL